MSWPRQGSQNPLDNRECKWKTWISWVWGFEVVHAVKGSFKVALPPNASLWRVTVVTVKALIKATVTLETKKDKKVHAIKGCLQYQG